VKIGVNLWIWESPFRTDRHLGLLTKAKSAGADIVEFALEDDGVIDARALRGALAGEGLECSTLGLFGPDRDFSSPEQAVRQRGVQHALRCLETAQSVQAGVLSGAVLGVGGAHVLSPEDRRSRLGWAAECLRQVGEAAGKAGVRFCVEVLNRYETNLVNTAREACELIARTDHAHVGIHLDTFHMNIEETVLGDAIRECGASLFHLHGSDSHRGAPGDGHIQWEEIATALADIHYDGAVVFESFNPAGRLAPLARFWRPFTATPDEIARRGIETHSRHLKGAVWSSASP
jgi:D-psicose/D-tagatose/L-ribulose 3-epimerase